MTNGEDPYDDAVVKKLIHPNMKLLLVTEGPDGCRYYSKVMSISDMHIILITIPSHLLQVCSNL